MFNLIFCMIFISAIVRWRSMNKRRIRSGGQGRVYTSRPPIIIQPLCGTPAVALAAPNGMKKHSPPSRGENVYPRRAKHVKLQRVSVDLTRSSPACIAPCGYKLYPLEDVEGFLFSWVRQGRLSVCRIEVGSLSGAIKSTSRENLAYSGSPVVLGEDASRKIELFHG